MRPQQTTDSLTVTGRWAPRYGHWLFRVVTAVAPIRVGLWLLGQVPGAVSLGAVLLWLALAHLGSFYAPSGIFGSALISGRADQPLVALTFDDGPDPETTPQVLQVLARHGVRATFFVIGQRVALYPEVVAAIAQAGHQIESHSLRHSWWTAFTPRRRLAAELLAAQEIIAAACGRAPRWFRAPIGILSPEVVAAAQRVGLQLCGWSCKARDGLAGTSVGAALARLLGGLRPGAILLLHDAPESAAAAGSPPPASAAAPSSRPPHVPVAPAVLEQLLPELSRRQLRAVTLDELVGLAPLRAPDSRGPAQPG